MKKVTTNQPNKIISRIKEGFEGLLSMFDGNKYTTSEDEVSLPKELIRVLENLSERAGRYEDTGTVDLDQTEKNMNIQPEYTPLETPRIKPNKQPEYSNNRIIENNDGELEL